MLKPQSHWPHADWLGLIKQARGDCCPSDLRCGPTAPGEETLPCPGQQPFHISTTSYTRGRKGSSPRSIPPQSVWEPQSHRAISGWLGLLEPTRGKGCPSGQRRAPAAPGEDMFSSTSQKSSHISTTPTTRGCYGNTAGLIPPHRVGKPQSHRPIADWLGFLESARGENCPLGQHGPAAAGEDTFPSPRSEILPYLYNSEYPGTLRISRVNTTPQGVGTPVPLADC